MAEEEKESPEEKEAREMMERHLRELKDPGRSAIRRGKVFARGARCEYRRTPVTLIGFTLLGSLALIAGLLFLSQVFSRFGWSVLFYGPVGAVLTLIGVKVLKSVFRKPSKG